MAILSKDTTIGELEVLPNLVHSVKFVIGTSTSGHTLRDCDYLCDGVGDQTEISQALNDLPDIGGEIIILNGTYNITASINIAKDNTTLSGNGNNTILKRMWNSTATDGIINLFSKNECTIQNLYIDGNKGNFNNSYNYGIYLNKSSNSTITGNTCNNNNYGIRLYSSSNNNISGNTCTNNNNIGIYLYSSSDNNTVTGNTCNNNSGSSGIYLDSASNSTITGNTCNNNSYGIYLDSLSSNSTITGNTCNGNSYYGIYLYKPSNNTITGNTCNNSATGIYSTNLSNSTITGNTCNNNTRYGINLFSSSSNNTITGNTCNNNSDTGIRLNSSCTNNTIVGNTCIRGTGLASDYTSNQYNIYLQSTTNNYNLIAYNNIMGKNYTSDGGTGNTFTGNKYS